MGELAIEQGVRDGGRLSRSATLDFVQLLSSQSGNESPQLNRTDVVAKNGTINFADHGDIYGEQHSLAQSSKPAEQIKQVEFKPGISFEFKQSAKDWLADIPPNITETINKAGIKVIFADNAKQVIPNADKIPARGHADGETIAMQPGFYYPPLKAVVMVQHHDLTPGEQRAKQINEAHGIAYLSSASFNVQKAWHELGHALDYAALKNFTWNSRDYLTAYKQGFASIATPEEKAALRYYVQPDQAGQPHGAHEETFAQVFAVMHTARRSKDDELLLQRFSKLVDVMKKQQLF